MVNENIKKSEKIPSAPSTTHHIGESIEEYLADKLAPRVTGDEEKIRQNAIEVSRRRLLTRRTDTIKELAATDALSQDMAEYSIEIGGDPEFDAALEKQKRTSAEIYLDSKELPPAQE